MTPAAAERAAYGRTRTAGIGRLAHGATICGFYGNHNLGDEAMLAGLIALLRGARPQLPITVLSADPAFTRACHGVEAVSRTPSPLRPAAVAGVLRRPLFVLGGGDLLRDTPTESIARTWLRFLQLAQRLRRRTIVAGVSVGEISRADTRLRIVRSLARVDLLAVRDESSRDRLVALGVERPILVMSDLALASLRPATVPRPTASPPQVGVSVRFLYQRGRAAETERFEPFLAELAATVDALVEQRGAHVHVLPLCTRPGPVDPVRDDYVCALELARRCVHSQHVTVHRRFASPAAFTSLLSTLDLVIGMRLHALILALGLGIPVVAAEYDSKVLGFMTEVAHADLSVPLGRFTRRAVLPLCAGLLDDRVGAGHRALAGIAAYRRRMAPFETALAGLLG